VADRSSQLILAALSRAAAGGAPLHGTRSTPGLFPATAAGKQAAARCREEGYLRPAAAAPAGRNGKPAAEPYALTDKGFSYLLGQVSPREVLEDFVRTLEAREAQFAELLAAAQQARDQLTALRAGADQLLRHLAPPADFDGPAGGLNALFQEFLKRSQPPAAPPAPTGADACVPAVLRHLARWQTAGTTGDCPLPELYRLAARDVPGLSVGQFHDALRRLHEAGQVYLHPWTGPLYEVPEPPCALLVGHEIAYYASLRPEM
jgi:hypothetical protein